jgi:hypothetical protein
MNNVARAAAQQYVLCVMYKGKPTHHLVHEHDGGWRVNKKSYGDFSTMNELIEALMSGNASGWPVKLAHPVPRKDGSAPKRKPTGKPKPAVVEAAAIITAAAEEGEAMYYHRKKLKKEDASELVIGAGSGDGTYLVYDHESKGQVLCVVYKGKPTFHLISPDEDGKMLINKKPSVAPPPTSSAMQRLLPRGGVA